jgi:predicted flap endonuclease-1-like 5' DNA nuclease
VPAAPGRGILEPSGDQPKGAGVASIETIEGIGAKYATKLRKSRVRTTEALLKRGATKKGRDELATETGFSTHQILEWVNRADLMRVKGVGEEYSDLLEAAGVDTVKELRNRNSANLLAKMVEVNSQKRLVRRLPTLSMVERWVAHAKDLQPVVKY